MHKSAPTERYCARIFENAGLSPNVWLRSANIETIRGLVGRGLGYSILVTNPSSAQTADGRKISAIPLEDDTPQGSVAFASDASRPCSELARELVQECRKRFI